MHMYNKGLQLFQLQVVLRQNSHHCRLCFSACSSSFFLNESFIVLDTYLKYTVKPLNKGHPFCGAFVATIEGWPLLRGFT